MMVVLNEKKVFDTYIHTVLAKTILLQQRIGLHYLIK